MFAKNIIAAMIYGNIATPLDGIVMLVSIVRTSTGQNSRRTGVATTIQISSACAWRSPNTLPTRCTISSAVASGSMQFKKMMS